MNYFEKPFLSSDKKYLDEFIKYRKTITKNNNNLNLVENLDKIIKEYSEIVECRKKRGFYFEI